VRMSSNPTGHPQLARRLRKLREERWPDFRLTQAALAEALSAEGHLAAATISSWENPTASKLPPRHRLMAYALFFATRRSISPGPPHLVSSDALLPEEQAVRDELQSELLTLRDGAAPSTPGAGAPERRSWQFSDPGPVTIVCAQLPEEHTGTLADPAQPNYTELQSLADLDALVELHGHVRAENPDMDVFFKASSTVVPDDLSGHVVLLGGIAWNEITEPLSEMTTLPVRQVRDPAIETGEVFEVDTGGGKPQKFVPRWHDEAHQSLKEDVGFLGRAPNPLKSNRTLTICNGVHSRGVLGAVRSLTDARLRHSNEKYIAENFGESPSFALLITVRVIGGKTMTPDFNAPGCVLYQWSGHTGA
jgi:hypothetical protein